MKHWSPYANDYKHEVIARESSKPGLRGKLNAKCAECIYDPLGDGTWRQQVAACTNRSCPLWTVRPIPEQRNEKQTAPSQPQKVRDDKPVHFCTDGACSGNPGPGGWGVAQMDDDGQRVIRTHSGHESQTTNQRMEMMAAIQALEMVDDSCPVVITTDSKYVIQGITEWIHGWKSKGWRNASGKPVKNRDLWERLDGLNQASDVTWKWVKGHSGHPGNEAADSAAQAATVPGMGVY